MSSRIPITWLLLLLMLGAGGCGESTTSGSVTPAVIPAPTRVLGALSVPDLATRGGLKVRAVSLDALTLAEARTNDVGTFALTGLPSDYRVEVTLADGLIVAREVRGDPRGWLWVNGATTLVSRLMQRQPALTLAEATGRVKSYLGIAASVELDSLGDTWRSPFSWSEFVTQARDMPLSKFIDEHITAMTEGGTATFRRRDPLPGIHSALDRNFITGEGGRPRPPLQVTARTASDDPFTKATFGFGVATGIAGNLVSGALKASTGAIMEACGCNYGAAGTANTLANITNQLNEIQSSLDTVVAQGNQIIAEVTALQTTLTADAKNASLKSALNQVQPAIKRILQYSQSYQAAVSSIQGSLAQTAGNPTIARPFTGPPGAVTNFISDLHAYYNNPSANLPGDILTLRQYMLGLEGTNCLPLLLNENTASAFGSNEPSGTYLFLDVRNNASNEQACNNLDQLRACQFLALNLVAEYCHADATTFPVVLGTSPPSNVLPANLVQAATIMRQMTADLLTEGQLVPTPSFASDEIIMHQNVMFCTNIQHANPSANSGSQIFVPFSEAEQDLTTFSLGPWKAGSWTFPSVNQLEGLYNIATSAGGGNVFTGLTRLGFTIPPGANSSGFTFFCSGGTVYDLAGGSQQSSSQTTAAYYIPIRYAPGGPSEDPGTAAASSAPTGYTLGFTATGVSLAQLQYPLYPLTGAAPTSQFYSSVNGLLELPYFIPFVTTNGPAFEFSNIFLQLGLAVVHSTTNSNGTPAGGSVSGSIVLGASQSSDGSLLPTLTPAAGGFLVPYSLTRLNPQPTNPTLLSIFVTPQNRLYTTTNEQVGITALYSEPYFATGSYSDGTFKDLTNSVTWAVSPTGALNQAYFETNPTVFLKVPSGTRQSSLSITATDPATGMVGTSNAQTEF